MKYTHYFRLSIKSVALTTAVFAAVASSAVTIPNTPLVTQINAKPMVMLIASKDHKLFVDAYNDASDLDGDGKLDIHYKPAITYYGLFDSNVCYTDNGDGKGNTGLFTPNSAAGTLGKCPGKWSGNWLNYVTTSRIDSLRKVLYGGYREVDSTTETILRRAYIPQDGHSWAKEYTSSSVDADGYNIGDYTPLSQPDSGKRHFFGNVTLVDGISCVTLDTCSNKPPLLSVVTNSSNRVWEWASKESPVLDGTHGGTRKDYTVRVQVCTSSFNQGCKQYGSGIGSTFKPTGVLHDYGENDAMLFGLLTGSYDKNMSGGVLRKVVSSFKDEIDPNTGIFSPSNATIVNTFNKLRIRDYNNVATAGHAYRNGSFRTGPMLEGAYVDWGNPVAEMMYESVRYFAGKKVSTTAFDPSTRPHDVAVGLARVASWDDPYSTTSAAKAPRCARPTMLVMSDVYPSYDADQIPGSPYSALTGDITGLNTGTLLDLISAVEPGVIGSRFIGQSTAANLDYAPTAKPVTTLSTVRGLAPEETTKQGSYNAAAIAYFAKINDVNATATGKQTIDSYMLALSSTLPKVDVLVNGKIISIVPFAKTIDGASTNRTKGAYQPTDQIVDLYITKDDLAGASRQMQFRINYEADEQGNDYDMDVVAEYTVTANSDNTVTVEVEVKFQSTGSNQNVGYVISGTNRDGIYLVAQDKNEALDYFLNVPPNRSAGYCDSAINLALAECKKLPYLTGATPKSTQKFSIGTTSAAQFLRDPLWYAAKWGGFVDYNNNSKPDQPTEWDADSNGVPDNYFLVQNPLKLKEALKRAFDSISKINSSASNVIANSTSVTTNSRIFQARFDANYWSGDLVAYPVASSGVTTSVEWKASDRVPTPASRNLVIRTTSGTTKEFLWSNLAAADKALLDTDTSTTVDNSQDIVDYLRGVRSKEFKNAGNFRDRPSHVLGDIVHSSPFYVQDTDAIFVSGNDGMLHAFKASNAGVPNSAGTELFGFIPSEVVSRLKNLTSTGYTHEFFVDGDVVVSPKTAETNNKNLLFGALGRGGKGLFGLDVTTPTSFGTANFLWEYTPTGNTDAASDADLGLMLGRPVYAKMNNGTGAIIVGNGYNSTGGKAVLYIFLLNTSGQITEVKKIETLAGGDNGLATPGVFDADGNGTIDYIYAGDLKGNVWKFDVSGTASSSWSVALSGSPLFVAKDASNQLQPITAPISVAIDTVPGDTHEGKRFVFFGTGSYFRTDDPADTSVQTWYGLIDDVTATTSISGRSVLRARTISGSGTVGGRPVRSFSAAATGDMVGKKGWMLDFTFAGGERIVTKSNLFQLVVPTLVASSIIPNVTDPCVPGGSGYVNFMSPFKGGTTSKDIADVDADNKFDDDKLTDDDGNPVYIDSVDLGVGLNSEPVLVGDQLCVGGTSETNPVACIKVNKGGKTSKGRISWREIIKD